MRNICDTDLMEQSATTTNFIVEDMDQLKRVNVNDIAIHFTSQDAGGGAISEIETVIGDEKLPNLFQKISKAINNIRYIWKLLGTTDISSFSDGTVTNALAQLNSNLNIIKDNNPLEWKTAGAATGTEKIDISNIGDYTELLVTGYFKNSGGSYVIFQTIIAKEQLDNTLQIFNLNGYMYSSTDFGYISVNGSNSYIQLRYAINAGVICTDTAQLKIRYR